jgi:hypothetical protein
MKTTYQANVSLDYDFGRTTYTPPTTWYVGLSTTAVDMSGVATEPSLSSGYSRVAVTNDKTKWSNASNMELYNTVDITFPEATSSWGTVTYVALFDSATGGNMRFYEALPTPRVVQAGASLLFAQQTLKVKTV